MEQQMLFDVEVAEVAEATRGRPDQSGASQKRRKIPKWKIHGPVVQYDIYDYMALLDSLERSLPRALKKDLDLPGVDPEVQDYHGWTEDEVKKLHCVLLEQSLRELKHARGRRETKLEILRWIKAPFEEEPRAFSFQACCMFAGVDAEEMQDRVLEIVENLAGQEEASQ